jgi:transcriptional regulator with PAS, ATPase and Fis domain
VRFFRADDPFDLSESFSLAHRPEWLLGRVDASFNSVSASCGLIGSRDDALMSKRHARLVAMTDGWQLADYGSKNGTFIDGVRLEEPLMLKNGDVIECGQSFFIYQEGPELATRPRAPRRPSTAFSPLLYQIAPLDVYLDSDLSIHLHGETGTGKEVVARTIHELSGRTGQFVALNCAAIPENLFESELFGYAKGAFSGASEHRRGQILAANGGTLFLDEIGELSLDAQAKLLRALELKEILPLGGQSPVPVDFRLVSATLTDLSGKMQEGRFRRDLYARLGQTFLIPPLREHKGEIGALVRGVLAAQLANRARAAPAPVVFFSRCAARALLSHSWPLNIRELRQCIESSLTAATSQMAEGQPCRIDLHHLPSSVVSGVGSLPSAASAPPPPPLPEKSSDWTTVRSAGISDDELRSALRKTSGRRADAARLLGTSERTVFRRLKKLRDMGHDF